MSAAILLSSELIIVVRCKWQYSKDPNGVHLMPVHTFLTRSSIRPKSGRRTKSHVSGFQHWQQEGIPWHRSTHRIAAHYRAAVSKEYLNWTCLSKNTKSIKLENIKKILCNTISTSLYNISYIFILCLKVAWHFLSNNVGILFELIKGIWPNHWLMEKTKILGMLLIIPKI